MVSTHTSRPPRFDPPRPPQRRPRPITGSTHHPPGRTAVMAKPTSTAAAWAAHTTTRHRFGQLVHRASDVKLSTPPSSGRTSVTVMSTPFPPEIDVHASCASPSLIVVVLHRLRCEFPYCGGRGLDGPSRTSGPISANAVSTPPGSRLVTSRRTAPTPCGGVG